MAIGYRDKPAGVLDHVYRFVVKQGSKLTPDTSELLLAEAQTGFKKAQRVAYDCVTRVGEQLHLGMTELEAASLLEDYLRKAGSERFLHRPFAWFGDHSRFDGYQHYGEYHPSQRRLSEGDVVILDVSPVIDGYTADVGYTLSMMPHIEMEEAMSFLLELREIIPVLFASSMTPKEIWSEINHLIAQRGFDNIHARYPFCVLGHRVFRLKANHPKAKRIPIGSSGWFSIEANLQFLKTGFSAALTPENVGSKIGLWAIEPHIGWHGGGAKFEEILVVDHQGARWLDDDVPHVTQRIHKQK
ncbi:MAG: aminopeptidase P family protein [Gammaproteobacteria bacterium]|nr:aminopeptidase P family protein [Gammaproteobacteria bacterium]